MAENNTPRIHDEKRENVLPQVAIRMVQERPLISNEKMDSPKAAIHVMSEFLSQMDRELVCVVNLQSDMKPINMNIVSMGALSESLVHPREMMKSAILSNAHSFMMIHNHPSGNLVPSKEDIAMTDRMHQVGELLGIQMVDHIITGRGNEYYSFHEKDTIPISRNHFTSDIDQLQIGNKVAEEQTGYSTESNPVKNDHVQTAALPVQGKDMNSIMQSLEMGVQNFLEGDQERYKEFLKVMTKFHNYSVNNTLLIAMQRPDATLCNSYKRWQSLGRQVKRGEKGITIIAPAPVKTKQTRERKDQYQQPVIGEDGHPELEEVEVVIPRFRPTTVFAYEQTEGEPLPFLVPEELTASVENYEIFMEAITRVSTVPIRFDEITNGAKGYYSNATKEIVINKGMSESQTMKTAVHECAHSLLHDEDIMMSNHVEIDRMTKEIEAESCAFCVCAAFNLDTGDYSFPYISGWSKEHDMKELKGSLDLIRKTSGEFIDKVTQEMQAIIEERTKAAEVQMEGTISFYVAECMEFPVMGEFHDGLSLDEAIKVYESIPSDRMHGIKGIGFDLQDDSIYSGQYELFSGDKVLYDAIDLVDHYKKNPIIQDAMKKLETYAAEKKQKNQSVSNTQEKKQEQVADKPPKKKEAMSL
nr:JAB domain-containing protein [uncultured Blautia sp.]